MATQALKKQVYEPDVIVNDISKLTESEWLAWRRKGIGGSDTASILGISPWRTKKELFWDKTGQAIPQDESDASWLTKQTGHALEDVVAELFARKNPEWQVFNDTRMFQHPVHKFMLADLDRVIVNRKTGQLAILEIKTCDPHTLDHWGDVNDDVVPPYYESQGRHYMAVTGIGMVVYAVLGGTREGGYRQRYIVRDMEKEAELIKAEEDFWNNHVVLGIEPEISKGEDAGAVIDALTRRNERTGETAEIDESFKDDLSTVAGLEAQIKDLKKEIDGLKKQEDALLAPIIGSLKGSDGHYALGDNDVTLKCVTRKSTGIRSGDLAALKLEFPETYDEFVKTSESSYWKFGVKARKEKKK